MDLDALFFGSQADCKRFCRNRIGHYVYILHRPDGRPFYVGKGTGDRAFHHENEARHANGRLTNTHKLNVIRSIWRAGATVGYTIAFWSDDPAAAYAYETSLIRRHKRLHEGGILTNRAPGGGSVEGASPFSKVRHNSTLAGEPEDNPERAILNRFVLSIAPMRSVILKPLGQFTPKRTIPYPSKTMTLSLRQSAAIVASAASRGIRLDAAATIPRLVEVDGIPALIENGVSCDLVTSGSAILLPSGNPADEAFALTEQQAAVMVDFIGRQKCSDLGLV